MILVTGGCGFIGSASILQWLESTDKQVVNLDLLTYAGHSGNLSAVEGDARYHRAVRAVLEPSVQFEDGIRQTVEKQCSAQGETVVRAEA